MSKSTGKNKKRNYTTPFIELILIDKEIALQLSSLPPVGPGNGNNMQHHQMADPYKQNQA